jgi:hypothetical protein
VRLSGRAHPQRLGDAVGHGRGGEVDQFDIGQRARTVGRSAVVSTM